MSTKHPWLAAVVGAGWLTFFGCSVLYGLDGQQCRSSADCELLGFPNRSCVVGLCRTLAEPSPAGGDSGAGRDPGGETSGPDGQGVPDAGRDASLEAGGGVLPTIALVASVPASGDVEVSPATGVALTFETDVVLRDGEIAVRRVSDDYAVEAVPLDDPRVALSGDTVVVDFDATLAGDTDYYVAVSAGAIGGTEGRVFAGLGASSGLSFRTAAVTAPGDVSAGLVLWLDADYAASLKTEDAHVASWGDRSGQGHVLRQAASGSRPLLVEAALGGKNTLAFDGASAWLAASRGVDSESWDAFVVWRSPLTAAAGGERLVMKNGGRWSLRHGGATPGTERSITRVVGAESDTLQLGEVSANTPHLWNFTYDEALRRLSTRTNGSGPATLSGLLTSEGESADPLSLGGNSDGSLAFSGEIAEVVAYDRVLGAAERQAVVDSLESKWGLSLSRCASGEVLGPNDRCYFLETTSRTWNNARISCQQRGSGWNLAAIRNELDNRFAVALARAAQVWVGGQDDQPQPEQFVWSVDQGAFWNGTASGAPVGGSYVNWGSGEPNGGSDQADCVRLLDTGLWADYTCSASPGFGSICEGPAN